MDLHICQNCCNYMNKSKYITCTKCRSLGYCHTSPYYGKLMGWKVCYTCEKQLVDPDKSWLECNKCYYYKKRTDKKYTKHDKSIDTQIILDKEQI
jgi:hypothetical protein